LSAATLKRAAKMFERINGCLALGSGSGNF
jgi:hypothetical protein